MIEIKTVLISIMVSVVFVSLSLYRNGWVHEKRSDIIDLIYKNPKRYWSYYKMFFCFWIWDVEKMTYRETK